MTSTAGCFPSRTSRRFRVLAACALAVLAAGCAQPSGVGKLMLYPVKGSVKLPDGKPLTGGKVVFVAKDGALSFTGAIQPDGSFTLSSGASGDGAQAGDYRVRIEPEVTTITPGKKVALPFPAKYTDEDDSGLTATVKAEPNQLEPFRLDHKPSAAAKAVRRRIDD